MKSYNRTRIVTRTILFVVLGALIVAGYALWSWRASSGFSARYAAYYEAEQRYIIAANKPAAASNPIRQQVSLLLSEVLQVQMQNNLRIEKAQQGIRHLDDMEGQIDAIKLEADKVLPLLDELERSARSPGNALWREESSELIRLARRQIEIISDIRGLSYRADYYTTEIFERIIDDNGVMTDEHTQYLNDIIPQLEEQFDKRANLYSELKENDDGMKKLAGELGLSGE